MRPSIISLIVLSVFGVYQNLYGQMSTEPFTFNYDGKIYSGLLDSPPDVKPSGIIVMVHGHGQTNVVEENWYATTRSKFASIGMAVCVWDKAGCGLSKGVYEHNQSVQSSAKEALAAIKKLRDLNIVDDNKIGLWGISRAGWICPLIIEEDQSIAFWISVSGTDNLDNFRYLLESNLQIEGRRPSQIDTIMSEWDFCNKYQRGGKTYDEFIDGTRHLFQDPFCKKLGMGVDNEDEFNEFVRYYKESGFIFDEETGLQILVPEFEETLNQVNCPVLAISGENDTQVDWRKTISLYEGTIGQNKDANLTIKILPQCNHNMNHYPSETTEFH